MLENLDRLNWASFEDAYGPATDVPELIRALLSPNRDERLAAHETLGTSICHQGSIYESSVQALPFLIDLLVAEETPDRHLVAALVASIIDGRGYEILRINNPFTGKPIEPPADAEERVLRGKALSARAREQGIRALPHLLPFLEHEDPWLRATIPRALALYPREAATTVPALTRALPNETFDEARDAMKEALKRLA